MKRLLKSGLKIADTIIARTSLALFEERPSLIVLLLHSIVGSTAELSGGAVDPTLALTSAEMERAVEHFLEKGYRFIAPEDLLGPMPTGRYAMLTADDGYANNELAIPVLDRLGVPLSIYLSTGHIEEGKSFWWDILYRERSGRGASRREVSREKNILGKMKNHDIEGYLVSRFGKGCLRPVGDIDRPFRPAEVSELASHPRLRWGNHTCDHAVLNNYSREEAAAQIEGASAKLRLWTGKAPTSIAYPDGAHRPEVLSAARDAGLRVGFTTERRKNRLPLEDGDLLKLGRLSLVTGEDTGRLCARIRSDFNLTALAHGIMKGYR